MDFLQTMFGDLDPDDIDPKQLETETTKILCQQATKAKEAAIEAKHGPIPTDGITHITITSVPIPIEFGIPEVSLPETKKYQSTLYQKSCKESNTILLLLSNLFS